MEDWDVARVVEAYADSAERAKAAGLGRNRARMLRASD